ncbi:U4/U6.U5 tri-snRNP-associated protein 1 [Phytophthora nicotianae]|uniref:U4/U6.U5 tri-snRNP-associated protein 1 n=1 Tax=Phytophthora nicotianae TaxID=4792 RepID=A0A0W8D4Z3_PHYNI|nr:U4/U6.U5 tri-snRNP-associated protein 1 [Phytophthora nicotianae]
MALYVWGHNNSQQLGLDVADKEVFELRQVEALRNEVIVDFSAGERHSLALNEFGQVFAWGRGREGQLGLGDVAGVASAVSQPVASAALSGDVFMWGLLPVAKVLYDENGEATDASDRATVELAGLSSEEMREAQRARSRAELRRHMDDNIMARLVRDSMQVYEDAGVVNGENVKVQTVRAPCMTPRLATGLLSRLVVTTIAAGFAHSLATTNDGAVFSCGYNDNGQLGLGPDEATNDDDPKSRSGVCFSWGLGVLGQLGTGVNKSWLPKEVKLARPAVSVAAGSHHSVAVTDDGKVYTWGHNNVAVAVGAGSNHCAVAVQPRGAHYSLSYDRVLANSDFADLVFVVGGSTKGERIKAHRVIVSARSSYIKGLLRVLGVVTKNNPQSAGNNVAKEEDGLFEVAEFQDVDAQVFRAYLTFLYTNRLDVVSHKRKALGQFASRVCCDALVVQCLDTWRKERLASLPPPSYRRAGHLSATGPASSEAQQFGEDMKAMVLSEEVADVVFLWPVEDSDPENFERLPAHKAVLSQVEYFRTMFMGGFSEGKTAQAATAKESGASSKQVHEIPLHYMHRDGVSLEAFKGLLLWIYTGCFELLSARLEPSDMMDLYVGASLLGLTVLASRCELQLVELLPQLDIDSLRACEDFAERYDARRLQTMSQQVLRKQLPTEC